MSDVCTGCKVDGFRRHACEGKLVITTKSGEPAFIGCDCSVELDCSGWRPAAMNARGVNVTLTDVEYVINGILAIHVWSASPDSVCEKCGIRFYEDAYGHDASMTPRCVAPDPIKRAPEGTQP